MSLKKVKSEYGLETFHDFSCGLGFIIPLKENHAFVVSAHATQVYASGISEERHRREVSGSKR